MNQEECEPNEVDGMTKGGDRLPQLVFVRNKNVKWCRLIRARHSVSIQGLWRIEYLNC